MSFSICQFLIIVIETLTYLRFCRNIAVIPKPTSDNYRVIITQHNGQDDKDFQMIDFYRYHVIVSKLLFEQNIQSMSYSVSHWIGPCSLFDISQHPNSACL